MTLRSFSRCTPMALASCRSEKMCFFPNADRTISDVIGVALQVTTLFLFFHKSGQRLKCPTRRFECFDYFAGQNRMTMDRRKFLKSTVLIFSARTIGKAAFVGTPLLTLFPSLAQAWVQVAIAVASMVASMVAANNRSDGGIGEIISANYQLLKVALQKLTEIQTELAAVLTKLDELPDQIDQLLKQQDTRRLQTELLAVIRGYVELLKSHDPSISDEQWRTNPNTQRVFSQLLFRLESARQQVNVLNLTDPVTALVACPLGFVETNLKNLLGYNNFEITSTIREVYLPWLNSVVDPSNPNSAMSYAMSAKNRLTDQMKAASLNPIGASLKMVPSSVLLACTGVNDHDDAEWLNDDIGCYQFNELAPYNLVKPAASFDPIDSRPQSAPLTEPNQVARRMCHGSLKIRNARDGAHDRLALDVTLKEEELKIDGKPTGILNFVLEKASDRRANAGDPAVPSDSLCQIDTASIPDANARLAHMQAMKRRTDMSATFDALSLIIDQINFERSRIALGSNAVVAAEVGIQNLHELLRRYS